MEKIDGSISYLFHPFPCLQWTANGWRVSEVPFMGILASAVQPSVSRSVGYPIISRFLFGSDHLK
jgi:hypothetical protein